MTSKLLNRVAGAACAALLLAGVAVAKPVTVAPGNPPVRIDIPATWKVSEIKRGIEAKTADDEVYVWFESYRPAQFETLLAEHNSYFKNQGVTITGEAQAVAKDYPTYVLKFSEYPATYEGKPTVLRYVSVVPKAESKRHLLMSYWASPKGHKAYDAEMSKIMTSFEAAVEAM